jgi:hypothetical protein
MLNPPKPNSVRIIIGTSLVAATLSPLISPLENKSRVDLKRPERIEHQRIEQQPRKIDPKDKYMKLWIKGL